MMIESCHLTNDQVRSIRTLEMEHTCTLSTIVCEHSSLLCDDAYHVQRMVHSNCRCGADGRRHSAIPVQASRRELSTGPTSTAATITHLFSSFGAYVPHGISTNTRCYRTMSAHTHVLLYRRKKSLSSPGSVSTGASADTCSIARTGNTETAERLKDAAAPTLAANHRDQPGLSAGHRTDASRRSRLTRSLELCED